jgi:hypothetical protein
MDTIGIKVDTSVFNSKIAMVIRKYIEVSISDAKKIIESNNYIFECDVLDEKGIEKILLIKKDFDKCDISTILYEDDEITTCENLENILNFYDEIDKQVEADIDEEVLAKEVEN